MRQDESNRVEGEANRKSFTSAFRAAIWQAHKMRCAYTGEPISFSMLEIDHVIPIAVASRDLERLKADGVIPADFDLNGLENLLPTARFANGRKSNRLRGSNALVHFLDLARSTKPAVEKILHHDAASDQTLKGYLMLKAQAEQNELDIDDVIDIKRQEVEGLTRLTESPDVDEAAGVHLINAKLAEELLRKRLAIGGGSIHEVTVQNDSDEKTVCTTCEEFLAAKDAGLWPLTQFDMNCYGMADRACETLRAITRTSYAPASALRYPRIDCKDLGMWSSEWAAVLFFDGDEAEILARYPSLDDLASANLCQVTVRSKTAFEIQNDEFAVRVSELFRGDVDGDGEEEIVVFSLFYATEGTMRGGSVCVAKPTGAAGLLFRRSIEEVYSTRNS